jgi:hypothetical protein
MSFQAYLDNIKAKTGKTPDEFHRAARKAGLLEPGTTATRIVAWLAKDYDLGRGHAMAIFAVFKQEGWIPAARKTRK